MCIDCIRSQVDITEGIPKEVMLLWCSNCGRYLQPPRHWVQCELESRQLLVICLKRVKGLNKVKLIDAGFIWTEPHSRRIKVKLTVQKEVFTNTVLQQVFVIEFIVQNQMCEDCHRVMAKDTWNALVQVRQRVSHKRTFLFLEQLILKHKVHSNALRIAEKADGLDFYWSQKSHAKKFVEFLQSVLGVRYKTAEQLISMDVHSNIAHFKYTYSVEIPPVCKDDIVCLPKRLALSLGNISPLCVVWRVSNLLHMLDPLTLQACEMNAQLYWKEPFRSICEVQQLMEYIVLDVELTGAANGKFALADMEVAKVSDFGLNDRRYRTRSHLGHVLHPGDLAYGYDMNSINFNDSEIANFPADRMPDVILVRKSYSNKQRLRRNWKLQQLQKEQEDDSRHFNAQAAEIDEEMFMRELEEDTDIRSRVNLYKDPRAMQQMQQPQQHGDVDDYAPAVDVAELLDNLTLDDAAAAADAEDADYDDKYVLAQDHDMDDDD